MEIPKRLAEVLDDDMPDKTYPDSWPPEPNERNARVGGSGKRRRRGIRYLQNHLGHGTYQAFLYLILANMKHARVCVCLGSGRGSVPALMREGQLSACEAGYDFKPTHKKEGCLTYLVDKGCEKHSLTVVHNSDSIFRKNYPDIEVLQMLTDDSCIFFKDKGIKIDYLHIDACHSHGQSLRDFENFYKNYDLMSDEFIITLHDTADLWFGTRKGREGGGNRSVGFTMKDIRDRYKELDIIDFNHDPKYARGTAIIKPKRDLFTSQ